MAIRIQNLAAVPRAQWFSFTRPGTAKPGVYQVTGVPFGVAVPGPVNGPEGHQAQTWWAYMHLDGYADVSVDIPTAAPISTTKVEDHPIAKPLATAAAVPFAVTSSQTETGLKEPQQTVAAPPITFWINGDTPVTPPWTLVSQETYGTITRLHIRARAPNTQFVADMWADVLPYSLHIPFELMVTASNPEVADIYASTKVELNGNGTFVSIECKNIRGGRSERVDANGNHIVTLLEDFVDGSAYTKDTQFFDTQGLGWRGAFIIPAMLDKVPEGPSTVQAIHQAPIVAVDSAHAATWGPWKMTAQSKATPAQLVELQKSRWLSRLSRPHSVWEEPMLGQRAYSGITGDQDAFAPSGHTEIFGVQGTPPTQLWELYHAALFEACRPNHQREADGSLIDPANHPQWVTDAGYTHWHPGVSPDRLGKPAVGWPEPSGDFRGPDRQHWAQTRLAMAYILTGSPMLRQIIDDQITVVCLAGETINPGWSTTSPGVPRGIGRTLESLNWFWICTGDAKLKQRILDRVDSVIYPVCQDAVTGPIKVLAWYDPHPNNLGGRYPWWPCWEHSLSAPGLDATWQLHGSTKAKELCAMVCKTTVMYGWWKEGGAWVHGKAVRWLPDGEALPQSVYDAGTGDQIESYSGYNRWGYQLLKLALRYAKADGDPAYQARLKEIHDQMQAEHSSSTDPWNKLYLFAALK